MSLSQHDPRLHALLVERPAGEGWELEPTTDDATDATDATDASDSRRLHLTSPGWRASQSKAWDELGARLSMTANQPWEVGVSRFPTLRLRLTPIGAADALGELRAGHVLYPSAYGRGIDVVVTTSHYSVETLFFLHDRHSVARLDEAEGRTASFSWKVDLPQGITHVRTTAKGSLDFENARKEAVLRIPAPYAVDAEGTRRAAALRFDEEDQRLTLTLDTTGLAFPVLLDPAIETVVWRSMKMPSSWSEGAATYDAKNAQIVLFGGRTATEGLSNETWTWDGVTWTKEAPSGASPSPRTRCALAYDAARQKVVLFGGFVNEGTSNGETWTWNGTTWTKEAPATSPPARLGHAMTYDKKRQKVVLFGGNEVSPVGPLNPKSLADTWTWNGTTWTKESPASSPDARAVHAMAYDEKRQKVVLFGGIKADPSSGRVAHGDTWTWNGATWENVTSADPAKTPAARGYHGMAYDAKNERVVLYEGRDTSDVASGEGFWLWDGESWTKEGSMLLTSADYVLQYDENRQSFIHYGGRLRIGEGDSAIEYIFGVMFVKKDGDDDWSGKVLGNSALGPVEEHAVAYDAKRRQGILLGGHWDGEGNVKTMLWDVDSWTEKTETPNPGARAALTMAYDAKRENVVLFGGYDVDTDTMLDDTWTWNGAFWTQLTPPSSPSPRSYHAMTYDVARERVVLFGGFDTAPNDETWTWDGTSWNKETPATSPSARLAHSMAYDAHRKRTVLFGGFDGVGMRNDTWEWDGTTWLEAATSPTSPVPRATHSLIYDAHRKHVVLFGGFNSAASYNDTWKWDGTRWTEMTVSGAPSSPPARSAHAMFYDEHLGSGVLFGGYPSEGDTWLLTTRGHTCSRNDDCALGFCVDGVCCASAFCGPCEACDGATPGVCTPVVNAPDPDTCAGARSCSAAGICLPALGSRCSKHSECASGFCTDGVCCDSACEGNCQACSAETKESGPDGTCGVAKRGLNSFDVCSCTSDADCDSGYVCDVPKQSCVPRTAALCDGDHTLVASDGSETDCSPFKCSGTECKSACVSVLDCVYPNECSSVTHTCLPPLEARSSSSGCALGASPRGRSSLASTLALAVLGACGRRAVRSGASRRNRNDADVGRS